MFGSFRPCRADNAERVKVAQPFSFSASFPAPFSTVRFAPGKTADPQVVSTNNSISFLFFVALSLWLRLRDRVEAQLRNWRWGCRVELWGLLLALLLPNAGYANDQSTVRFDVPSLLPVIVNLDGAAVASAEADPSGLMTIALLIPVTTEIGFDDRDNVQQFRFDINWNRYGYPLVDYAPRTQTTSSIDGSITHETKTDKAANFGLTLNSGTQLILGGSGKAELVKHDEQKTRYKEVPQHDVLVASGSTNRGTGAFFRFHRSRKETLEGGRDLHVSFRVPYDWRAGLLDVKCRAEGSRTVMGAWSEPFSAEKKFVLPIYLDGDVGARDRAVDYVRTERSLLRRWQEVQRTRTSPTFESSVRSFFGAGTSRNAGSSSSADAWFQSLIQNKTDAAWNQNKPGLPRSVELAAEHYVKSRAELLNLSR